MDARENNTGYIQSNDSYLWVVIFLSIEHLSIFLLVPNLWSPPFKNITYHSIFQPSLHLVEVYDMGSSSQVPLNQALI